MLKKSIVAQSIALAFGMAVVSTGLVSTAFAQSNTTGSIFGEVVKGAGDEVVVESASTGVKRSLKPDASGRFNFTSLPTGTYRVTLLKGNTVVTRQDNVEVRISQGAEVILAGGQTVQVTASAATRLDVSSAGSTTVFTATELARLPVASNVGAIVQLAPNTTRGDSRYGGAGAPSFGGASASENAVYINGFPVTTLLTQVGFSQLPFNSIAQAQVLTGGYGAEFGRSTGGVVNMITKRGGNEWVAGGQVSVEPKAFRERERDQYYENNGLALDGKFLFYNGLNTQQRTTTGLYAGGPIIPDKLFIYAAAEQSVTQRNTIRTGNTSATYTASAAVQSASFQDRDVTIPRYLVKLDFAITDRNSLEYTRIGDKVTDERKFFGFNYATLERTQVQNGGQTYVNWGPTPVASQQGADVDILKYTGNLTDNLTVTALVGQTKTKHEQTPVGFNPAFPQVQFSDAVKAPGLNYINNQTLTGNLLTPGAFDKNKGARVDVEYKLGTSHTLRAGVDYNRINSLAGASTAGGNIWIYGKTDPTKAIDANTKATNTVAGNPLAQQGYFVSFTRVSTGSTPTVDQQAQYIEDKWQLTKDFLLTLGLRNEGFDNKNGDGESYIKLKKQLAPRVSAVWDTNGDSSQKLFASVGRYHVPLPTNVAVRGAGSSLNVTQNFVYTGIDPATGAPTGTTAISPLFSNNNELGQAKDPKEVAAQDMKGNYQDELALGIEKSLAKGWTGGAKVTYRALRTAIDDHCDDRPFRAWADRNNVDASHWGYNCALFNPGIGNTFTLDLDGDGKRETINLSAEDLGIPKVKRTYAALDLFVEHPFDGKWWGKATYTWARNRGNTEGQLLSDIGQGDVATTQAFDFPEFSANANGLLPNNRTHQLKAFAFYQATPEIGLGGSMVFASGRPRNCIGNAPAPVGSEAPYKPGDPVTNYSGYGSAYFFCKGVASPRGSAGNLPPEFNFDTNIVFSPSALKGLKLKVDIFNLFNRQVAEVIEERYNAAGGSSSVRTTYSSVQAYSTPRSVKFTVAYDHKF